MPQDNSTLRRKQMLRTEVLKLVREPVVLETHGGLGRLYEQCYAGIMTGIVLEKDMRRAEKLAVQRPTWRVYCADAVASLAAGLGSDVPVNLIDCDPWGEPWPTLSAFFSSERERPAEVAVAVNDGLRNKLKLGGAYDVASLQEAVAQFGNALYAPYLEVCRWQLARIAEPAGYTLRRFWGYFCGHNGDMTHYAAVLGR